MGKAAFFGGSLPTAETVWRHYPIRFAKPESRIVRKSSAVSLARLYSWHITKDDQLTRLYRTTNSIKIFSIVFFGFSLLCGLGIWRGLLTGANTWLELTIAIALVLAGAYLAAETFTARIVLTEDSIRYGSVFSSHAMQLDQIRYRREFEEYHDGPEGGTNVLYLEFLPRSSEIRSIKIPKDDFALDKIFWEWVLRIPEL